MEAILTGIFTICLLMVYAIVGFTIAMLIQLISYQIFNFNIYKTILKRLEV